MEEERKMAEKRKADAWSSASAECVDLSVVNSAVCFC